MNRLTPPRVRVQSLGSLTLFQALLWAVLFGFGFGLSAADPARALRVSHAPEQPRSGETVTVRITCPSAQTTDDWVLEYQAVPPGGYIALADPAYARGWTKAPLESARTDGAATKALVATLPPELQKHRWLIRYRLWSPKNSQVIAPDPTDTQKNFAYFVYDGVPEWRAAINPKGDASQRRSVTFETNVMRSVQAYHLISSRAAVENVTWREPTPFMSPQSREYRSTGTLVANGKVYDHVRFRARGGEWRHAMGKNMWKIDFNKGHHFEARDNYGRPYRTKWEELNLGANIQQGDYGMRGEHGMFEAVSFALFNLAGVAASRTHWVQLRIIDEAEENPMDQYRGDFWGLYLAIENPDGRFLEEHHLPDGNLYKFNLDGPKIAHLAKGQPSNRADVMQLMRSLRRPEEAWWRQNVDLRNYYSYRSILECVHHYDIGGGKNYYFFNNPATHRWQVVPWDLDLTWADHMFGDGGEPFHRAGLLQAGPLRSEYQERLAEIRDLLFNPDQTGALIDEYSSLIWGPKGSTFVDADRCKWDYHPILSSRFVLRGMKTEPGLYYRAAPTHDFPGMLQLMKRYIEHRGAWIDSRLLANAGFREIPVPRISPPASFALSGSALNFRLAQDGPASATKVIWRLAEVTDTQAPGFQPRQPRHYEINALWELEGGPEAEIPTKDLQPGHTYRVRARFVDASQRRGRWSAPLRFSPTK